MQTLVERTRIENNVAGSNGALEINVSGYNAADIALRSSVISGNRAFSDAIGTVRIAGDNYSGSQFLLEDSTIEGHVDNGQEGRPLGGLSVEVGYRESVVINRSTISGNQVAHEVLSFTGVQTSESGVSTNRQVRIENSTISGNAASDAQAAILMRGVYATINHSTFVDNAVTPPDGVAVQPVQLAVHGSAEQNGVLNMQRSILSSANVDELLVGGAAFLSDAGGFSAVFSADAFVNDVIATSGLSLSAGAIATSIQEVDPQLAPLADRGGLTRVHEPLSAASPAVDGGDSGVRPDGRDQRGVTGVVGALNDLGAVEFVDPAVNTPPRLNADLTTQLAGAVGLQITGITVTDAFVDDEGNTISVDSVNGLPPGLTFNAGSIAGTLTTAGTFLVTVAVSDNGTPSLNNVSQFTVEITPDTGGGDTGGGDTGGGDTGGGDTGGGSGGGGGSSGSLPLGLSALLAFAAALRRRRLR